MKDKSTSSQRYSPDVLLFLVLIPFINVFNYYLTYSGIKLGWFLFLTFSIDTVQGYVAWIAVRAFIFFLDEKIPYEENFIKRIVIQLFGTLSIGLLIITILTELLSWIVKGRSAPKDFYTVDLFIISIWFFVINGIYIGLYYYNLWSQSESLRKEENRIKAEGLLVQQGKQNIMLPFAEVAGFFVDGDYAVACTIDQRKFYMDQSLDKIEKTLPQQMFFRLNRQFILHRQLITGFTRSENGKILVSSIKHDCFQAEILVSRLKAAAFKNWFRGTLNSEL